MLQPYGGGVKPPQRNYMDSIERIKQLNEQREEDARIVARHTDLLDSDAQTQEIILKSFRTLVEFLSRNVSKTEVVNQLRSIGTPDVLQLIPKIESLHETLKTHENVDLTEITSVMQAVLDETKKIPKELPELKEKEDRDYTPQFQGLQDAIEAVEEVVKAQKLIAEAPIVNVPETTVNVDAPDLTPLQSGFKDVVKAVKAIVIPEYKTDNKEVEKLLKKTNKTLTEILEKPVRGGGGGGSSWVAVDENGTPVPVQLDSNGSLPVSTGSLAAAEIDPLAGYNTNNLVEEVDGTIYFGLENASGNWAIKKIATDGTTTYSKGASGYSTAWTNRATQTYDTFDNTFDPVTGTVITSTTEITSNIKAADSPSIDAFSRWRVSSPNYVFDASFQYDLQPLLFDQTVTGTGATITHDATNRDAHFAFSGTSTGQALMQTFENFRYQAGRSHLVLMTFNFIETAADTIKLVGYSDGNNGVELRQTGSTISINLLSDTDKGDESVAQANWNIDKMDGTGVSGVNVDWTKTHIFVIDFQWLGVGRIRCGLDIDGVIYYVHEFTHANIQTVAYMQTANLPLRAGMSCSSSSTTTMRFICSTVVSEGGQEDIGGFNFTQDGSATAASGTRTHILSLRPKTTFNSKTNRIKLVTLGVDLLVTGSSPVRWELCLGQAISGTTTFNDVNTTYSGVEYNTAGTASGSPTIVIASGYVGATNQSKGAIESSLSNRYPITLAADGSQRSMGTLTLLVTGIGGSSATQATIEWKEIR